MKTINDFDIAIIGGGLAGLATTIAMGKNHRILLIEKDRYPRHRVCGEYVSNEVLPYLRSLGVYPIEHGAKEINTLQISTHTGKSITSNLPMGGFGISRYALEQLLYEQAIQHATIQFETCLEIDFKEDRFSITTKEGSQHTARYVIGAFGKRSNLDKQLERKFIQKKSPWLAVKGHYQYNFEDNLVALHNFKGGYCGLSKTETGVVNACYLTTYSSFKKVKSIQEFQQKVMSKNPLLDVFFSNAKSLFDEPLTISQISFENKKPVENHIFMVGDSAGLIHPLCGNGMAMAVHSAKILSEVFEKHPLTERKKLEVAYATLWKDTFSGRLRTGRLIQKILLRPSLAKTSFGIAKLFPSMVPFVVSKTHGDIIV
ncbi:NAD(P)/FAD-dependent oxidoreductase [Marinirhabdus gelatinilytica]|uniref:Flavin-dependent dehydrogenase n=1 Tax=Marinirhabdus gelatinilytica TaxID=1703343 RepID=A0A370QA67_9FLAO|nr:NAD(P)/FAD-dependent oxidoreductase [Marinirhabdus gelatinilytica]RDK85199.1 flavin-dependent dehydrogenase [Marinirhabdus gelatinilytica]